MQHLVGLFDIHWPYEDRRAMAAVTQYIADSQPDIIVFGGDGVDNDVISNKSKRRQVESKRVLKDHDYARRKLEEIRAVGNPYAEIYYLQGNHDERVERYLDDHPELEGLLETDKLLGLAELDIKWIPSWRSGHMLSIGKANFIHGRWVNDYHAKTHVSKYGRNIFYGHTHDVQSYSQTLYGDDQTIVGQSCGCLCRYDMPYLQGAPTKWQQAFLNMYIRPNGMFNHQVVNILQKRFIVDGKEYRG